MNSFRQRIVQSINDPALQVALDNNSQRRLDGRNAAFASLPDWRERRQRAHAVRAEVIDRLDSYLDEFIKNASANRVTVHRAIDAAEAINIVLGIAGDLTQRAQSDTKETLRNESLVPLSVLSGKGVLIAKSKSMVSEEIELNHALEAENIRVVETDLGEYIVQLRHERPSHIITPAAHLRTAQIAQLFHEKLGTPYTEDIPSLTAIARQTLREVFLTADIGISGVNFAVAQTGGMCVVSNEGNARMVATVPPVHIALLGMERLVPSLDELALMLSLLARSATGQKLSVYTQLIHKPLPGQQRHVIILDNGRSRMRDSALRESLYCIRCGACLNACPVFRELGGHAYIGRDLSIAPYPGPIGSVVSPGLIGENFVQLAQASSLCGACKDACPVDIDLPKLLTRVRSGDATPERPLQGAGLSTSTKIILRMYTQIATRPVLFAASQRVAALTGFLVAPRGSWIRLPAFTGWGLSKDFPKFAGNSFRARWDSIKKTPTSSKTQPRAKRPQDVAPISDAQTKINLVEQFAKELKALGGHVHLTEDASRDIVAFLQSIGVDSIHLEPHAMDESVLQAAHIAFTDRPDAALRVGVTNALSGLADTGSVLVVDGAGSPLHASLLPEIHIARLNQSDILPSLADAMAIPQVRQANAAAFITGPSRTADIEMTLTIGVHGPKEIHVFVDVSKTG